MSPRSLQARVRTLDCARYHGGRRSAEPSLIVWHTTEGGTGLSSIDWLNRDLGPGEGKCSYHYVIERTGIILRMLHPDYVAYACGDSAWPNPIVASLKNPQPNRKCLNAISLSIAWANKPGPEQLTAEQIESGLWLAKVYMARYDIPLKLNVGHLEIAPGRKTDPDCIDMNAWRRQIGEYLEAA